MSKDEKLSNIEEEVDATSEEDAEVLNSQDDTSNIIQAKDAEIAQLKDTILRLHADHDNARKRMIKEMKEAEDYAVSGLAKDMVEILENLMRALKASNDTQNFESLREGIELTIKAFESALLRKKIAIIDITAGKDIFDPNYHEALAQQENNDLPNGTILEVAQSGYTIGARLLRPALVIVSKNS